jgi:hypothetical protein
MGVYGPGSFGPYTILWVTDRSIFCPRPTIRRTSVFVLDRRSVGLVFLLGVSTLTITPPMPLISERYLYSNISIDCGTLCFPDFFVGNRQMFSLYKLYSQLTTLVVISTDCIGSHKSNYHTITTTTAPVAFEGNRENMLHVAPLGHVILIQTQPVSAMSS